MLETPDIGGKEKKRNALLYSFWGTFQLIKHSHAQKYRCELHVLPFVKMGCIPLVIMPI